MGRGEVGTCCNRHRSPMLCMAPMTLQTLQSSSKKNIPMDQWEHKMQQVRVSKQDMNALIMNFLVTEVRYESLHSGVSSSGLITVQRVDI